MKIKLVLSEHEHYCNMLTFLTCRLYKCYIRIENEEKKFMIKLPECEVVTRKLVFNDGESIHHT